MSKQTFQLDSKAEPCKGNMMYCGSTRCMVCLKKLKDIISNHEKQNERNTRQTAKVDGLCYYCKKKGHEAHECRKLLENRETVVCAKCNKSGHVKQYCPLGKKLINKISAKTQKPANATNATNATNAATPQSVTTDPLPSNDQSDQIKPSADSSPPVTLSDNLNEQNTTKTI